MIGLSYLLGSTVLDSVKVVKRIFVGRQEPLGHLIMIDRDYSTLRQDHGCMLARPHPDPLWLPNIRINQFRVCLVGEKF